MLLDPHAGEYRPTRDGDEWKKKGGKRVKTRQAPTRKTKAAVDHRQNNKILRQRTPVIAQQLLYHAVAVQLLCRTESQRQVRSSAVGKQLKQKKSNSQA